MVKADLKRKICMNLEETHTATWHQQTFNFNKVKLFLESYDKTWLSQLDCTQKKLKYKNTEEKACLCCRCRKEFYQPSQKQDIQEIKMVNWAKTVTRMDEPLNQKFQIN